MGGLLTERRGKGGFPCAWNSPSLLCELLSKVIMKWEAACMGIKATAFSFAHYSHCKEN